MGSVYKQLSFEFANPPIIYALCVSSRTHGKISYSIVDNNIYTYFKSKDVLELFEYFEKLRVSSNKSRLFILVDASIWIWVFALGI